MQTPPIPPTAQAPEVRIRPLHTADAGTVAALHAASWRRAYRGMLTNAYLDSDLEAERHMVGGWTAEHAPKLMSTCGSSPTTLLPAVSTGGWVDARWSGPIVPPPTAASCWSTAWRGRRPAH